MITTNGNNNNNNNGNNNIVPNNGNQSVTGSLLLLLLLLQSLCYSFYYRVFATPATVGPSTPTTNMTPKTTTINSATSNNNNLVISTPTNDEIRPSLISPNVSDQIASEKKPYLKKVSYSKYIKSIFDINLNILMFFQVFKYHKY